MPTKTASDLANAFLNGRVSAWLSVKQTAWLLDVLSRERGDQVRHHRYALDEVNNDPHGYWLNIAPSRTALLKPVECLGRDCRVCKGAHTAK